MPKNLDKKCARCRREGVKLFLKGEKCSSSKCPMVKRNYPPGVHGQKRRQRLTEYGQQLREKQKAKEIYGIRERQFKNYYQKAMRQKGDTGEILTQMLELRLDNIIYRLGLVKSRPYARQLVNHGFFLVNGKKVNIPSYQGKPKDEIAVKPSKMKSNIFSNLNLEKLEKKETPSWIYFNHQEMKAKILNKPTREEVEKTFNPRLIVEFYSR